LAREPRGDEAALAQRKLRAIAIVATAAGPRGMVGGQAIDLQAVRPGPQHTPAAMTTTELEEMHARKTGALIRASAVVGAVLAGAGEPVIAAIDEYAAQVGLAFQIVDDILDVEAASGTLGKTAGKDAAAGKPTYPALYGIAQSRALAAACRERAYAALRDVGLDRTHLGGLADLVVSRKS
jgi:geranylgeranyl pyrophosphate synthase